MFFDSHCHISGFPKLQERLPQIVETLKKYNISGMVDAGIDLESSKQAVANSVDFKGTVFATAGIHPEILIPGSDLYDSNFDVSDRVRKLDSFIEQNRKNISAIGEIGLDFYWLNKQVRGSRFEVPAQDKTSKLQSCKSTTKEIMTNNSMPKTEIKQQQKELLVQQIQLAQKYNLPIVIHSRGAESDCLELLNSSDRRQAKSEKRILFHSYTGSLETAKQMLQNGFYISFNGILTYSNAKNVQDLFLFAFKNYPDQILSETDAPFLAPAVKRGESCEPADVRFVIEKMAELANLPITKVENAIWENSERFWEKRLGV